jgi:hypothetical protein
MRTLVAMCNMTNASILLEKVLHYEFIQRCHKYAVAFQEQVVSVEIYSLLKWVCQIYIMNYTLQNHKTNVSGFKLSSTCQTQIKLG